MALKFKLDSLEEVAEPLRTEYKTVEVNGKTVYILDVEGAVDKDRVVELNTKLNTFRKTNTRLADRIKTFTEFVGIELQDEMTPEDIAELLKEKRTELEEALKNAGGADGRKTKAEIEAEVVKRVETFKEKHTAELKKIADAKAAAEADLARIRKELDEVVIGQEILAEGAKVGLKAKAHPLIVKEALKIFRRVDGATRALDAEGDPVRGSDQMSEMTISDWVQNQALKEFDFAFEPNSGGGASGSSGGAGRNGAGSVVNPWMPGSFNMTEQMLLKKRDPATANRLEAEAKRAKAAAAMAR